MREEKISEADYKNVCLTIWGCIPVDKSWAISTDIFKKGYAKIISKTMTNG